MIARLLVLALLIAFSAAACAEFKKPLNKQEETQALEAAALVKPELRPLIPDIVKSIDTIKRVDATLKPMTPEIERALDTFKKVQAALAPLAPDIQQAADTLKKVQAAIEQK